MQRLALIIPLLLGATAAARENNHILQRGQVIGPNVAAKPVIKKIGTLDCDMVEATPVVFRDKLYFFEYVRPDYKHKAEATADSYFHFLDVATQKTTRPFAHGYHLGSAHVEGDTVYVYGVAGWGTSKIQVFWSKNLQDWTTATALDLPGWRIFNNSVCKADGRYVMAFEIDAPADQTGTAFTNRFAESTDLVHWKLMPPECVFAKDRYTACPSIRYVDGYYWIVYLEARPGPTYETHIVRSPDLKRWESSPLNPLLAFSDEDRRISNQKLSSAERERIAKAVNLNNSDVDFCEFQGQVVILYSWGNQQGVEHLAHAVYDGTLKSFLHAFFPGR